MQHGAIAAIGSSRRFLFIFVVKGETQIIVAIHVTFSDDRDEGAPEFPLILAIDWPDRATVDAFLDHPIRKEGRAATEGVLSGFFTGRIHHHVTTAQSFEPI
jgi:hypothetical protein